MTAELSPHDSGAAGQAASITLHVCITCQAGRSLAPGEEPEGRHLFRALAAHPAGDAYVLRETTCLASCERGCAAVLQAPGKWTYLLGRLDRTLAADLLAYVAAYGRAGNGTVMPSKRPERLAQVVLGRVPGACLGAPA